MKKMNTILNIFSIITLLFVANYSFGQPCSTCSVSWGAVQTKVFTNQTAQGKPLTCRYNIYVDIQTRVCNGKVEVRILQTTLEGTSASAACTLFCPDAGSLLMKVDKLLLQSMGSNLTVSKPSSCFYILEFIPSKDFKNCMGKEHSSTSRYYKVIPCGTGCCTTEYALVGGNAVALSSIASPCNDAPPKVIPTTFTVDCWSSGVKKTLTVKVVPPTTPLTCENACPNSGMSFKTQNNRQEGEINISNQNQISYKTDTTIGVFPNPANDEIFYETNLDEEQQRGEIIIFDIQGKNLISKQLENGYNKVGFDVKSLENGIYFYKVLIHNELKHAGKFIVQK